MKPDTIVIKPTSACVGACKGCVSRQQLYGKIKNDKLLEISDYTKLFGEFRNLGLKRLIISGGEPTLYSGIDKLITSANKFGFEVSLNTTGYMLTDTYLNYLDGINFSLHGHSSEVDAKLRNRILFDYTINGIKHAKRFRHLSVNVNTIVTRYNYNSLNKLWTLLKSLKIDAWLLSYVEADWKNKRLLLSEKQVLEFNNKIKPALITEISKAIDSKIRDNLRELELFMTVPGANRGLYNPSSQCERKENFCIILPNGDVHPCNMVEYTHEPIVGNLFKESFTNIWNSTSFQDFRRNTYKYCIYCPVNIRCNLVLG